MTIRLNAEKLTKIASVMFEREPTKGRQIHLSCCTHITLVTSLAYSCFLRSFSPLKNLTSFNQRVPTMPFSQLDAVYRFRIELNFVPFFIKTVENLQCTASLVSKSWRTSNVSCFTPLLSFFQSPWLVFLTLSRTCSRTDHESSSAMALHSRTTFRLSSTSPFLRHYHEIIPFSFPERPISCDLPLFFLFKFPKHASWDLPFLQIWTPLHQPSFFLIHCGLTLAKKLPSQPYLLVSRTFPTPNHHSLQIMSTHGSTALTFSACC